MLLGEVRGGLARGAGGEAGAVPPDRDQYGTTDLREARGRGPRAGGERDGDFKRGNSVHAAAKPPVPAVAEIESVAHSADMGAGVTVS